MNIYILGCIIFHSDFNLYNNNLHSIENRNWKQCLTPSFTEENESNKTDIDFWPLLNTMSSQAKCGSLCKKRFKTDTTKNKLKKDIPVYVLQIG